MLSCNIYSCILPQPLKSEAKQTSFDNAPWVAAVYANKLLYPHANQLDI